MPLEEFSNILVKIYGCSEISIAYLDEWMECDSPVPGFKILNIDELIEIVSKESAEEEDDLKHEVDADTEQSDSWKFAVIECALKWMACQS